MSEQGDEGVEEPDWAESSLGALGHNSHRIQLRSVFVSPYPNKSPTLPGLTYLLLGTTIFGAASAITRQLMQLGYQHLIDDRNPLSLCNILFVGNLCALLLLIALYRRQLAPTLFQKFTLKDWTPLTLVALLSGALAPALFFFALESTPVNTVILLSRIEPPLALALAYCFLKERIHSLVTLGSILSFIGIVVTILLEPNAAPAMSMGVIQLGAGEVAVLCAAVAGAIATVISQRSLQRVPLGFYSIYRTGLGTVIFFVAALLLYSPQHFVDVFAPVLWQWMLIYGGVIVVGGQLLWSAGLKRASSGDISLANSLNPLAGILFAFLILGETPTMAQYAGGSVVLLGIALSQWGQRRQSDRLRPPSESQKKTADIGAGFKGV